MIERLVRILRERFEQGMQRKPSWAREEVQILFDQCLNRAVAQVLDGGIPSDERGKWS